jgi:prepilin-type N-terminal cleavage/methylation domain-containing protein
MATRWQRHFHQGIHLYNLQMTYHKSHKQKKTKGFTLVELLVAMAILAMMMTSMFSMLSGSMAAWQSGNKRIEAAQNARVGLNLIASDLRRAIASQQISYTSNGTQLTNIIPFLAVDSPSTAIDLGGGAVNAEGSQQVFGVLATGKTNQPFEEFGYLCVYLSSDDGINMAGKKFYLVRKSATSSNADFYLRGNATTTFAANSEAFSPVIENCIRLELSYPQTNASGDIDTSSGAFGFTRTWGSQTNLPPGVLVSIWVLDSKTAAKLSSISGGALTAAQIGSVTNTAAPANVTESLLRQGVVRMQRFVPLNKN